MARAIVRCGHFVAISNHLRLYEFPGGVEPYDHHVVFLSCLCKCVCHRHLYLLQCLDLYSLRNISFHIILVLLSHFLYKSELPFLDIINLSFQTTFITNVLVSKTWYFHKGNKKCSIVETCGVYDGNLSLVF